MRPANISPEAETVKSLIKISGILALVIGILNLIWGAVLFILVVGVVGIVFGIIDIWIHMRCSKIQKLIDQGEIKRAKNETLVPMILGFIFSWIVVGILLLIAYIKYDEAIRVMETKGTPSPPPKF